VLIIGDMISWDIAVGVNAGIKTAYFSYNPSKKEINEKLLLEGNIIPDYNLESYEFLPKIIEDM